jgi:hypothetical protein
VTLFVREFTMPEALRREDAGRFQHEADWPPEHTRPLTLALSTNGVLARDEAMAGRDDLTYRPDVGIAAGRYAIGQMLPGWGMGDDQRLDEGLSLVWTSSPVTAEAPVELVGAPVAALWVSSTAEVAFVSVKLCDVAADGTSVLVTKGLLNLTHRDSHERPEPLTPGTVYAVRVPLQAVAYRFRPGHRLRLLIAAADFQNEWPTPLAHTLSVHYGPGRPSHVELPLAGERGRLPEPRFLPSDFPPLPPDQVPTPDYRVDRDFVRNTVTTHIRTLSGIGVNRSAYTVSIDRPAEAVVRSEFEYPLERPGLAVVVKSQCVTRSDAQAFHHVTQVEITVNGRPHWSKGWVVSVPRVGC